MRLGRHFLGTTWPKNAHPRERTCSTRAYFVLLVSNPSNGPATGRALNTNNSIDGLPVIDPQASGYSQRQRDLLFRTIEDQFHAIPDVKNIGISLYTPMEANTWSNGLLGPATLHCAKLQLCTIRRKIAP
jgi:hypothetical protein